MNSILLGINIDHVATVRQARYRSVPMLSDPMVEPDPVYLAQLAERGGADGITVHLREDRRHIQKEDIFRLRDAITTRLNFEMACTDAMVDIALALKPEAVCLVPESREEVTTEGGLDLLSQGHRVKKIIDTLCAAGIEVSLFIDPNEAQIDQAVACCTPVVELHTGGFANAYYGPQRSLAYEKLVRAAAYAKASGLIVNAGHGINYENIEQICAIPELNELNIGHTIISRALCVGMETAVREMKLCIQAGKRLSDLSRLHSGA
jgi:pyridoxine 5-phosphate synthase